MSKIEIKLVTTNFITRWSCHVCGGCTEKVCALAEGKDEHGTVRVCERCLEAGDIDARLERQADQLQEQAVLIRNLIGRLSVPSYAEWLAYNTRCDIATCAARLGGDKAYDAIMADDAAYTKYKEIVEGATV